jgi:hypothetical protein
MTSSEIEQIVNAEISTIQSFQSYHVTSIEPHLVKPYKQLCVSKYPANSELVFEVWVVFEEEPVQGVGYVIAFDEEEISENPYVLAIWNREKTSLDYVWHQTTFLKTLEGM